MARQVAHEIKNPLTPISLSVDLLKRARDEKSPEFDAIFDRTIDLVQRQVEHMREIASDFSAFAGARKPEPGDRRCRRGARRGPRPERRLGRASSASSVERTVAGGRVFVDRGELRRVLINLVSNALEAMAEGGTLAVGVVRVARPGGGGRDRDPRHAASGSPTEVRARLFEPYFTTRTQRHGARPRDRRGASSRRWRARSSSIPRRRGTGHDRARRAARSPRGLSA